MCGIAGLINFGENAGHVIEAMNEHMKDRGPDARGVYVSPDKAVALGHVRLAILDLSENGKQPMTSHSGRSVIVYNGEIYNAAELKKELLVNGICSPESFRGTSDTEVLLEYAEHYGLSKTLRKSKGMFAIALYDQKTGTLQLARDRVGEKPLYYGFVRGNGKPAFAFASDVGAFREIPGFQNPVNRKILPLYFSHGYIPAPYTIYEDVYKLEPGTILTLRPPYDEFHPVEEGDLAWYYAQTKAGDGTSRDRYEKGDVRRSHSYEVFWSMKEAAAKGQKNPFAGSEQEAADELERLLKSAIQGQMISDVPLGAFLSAGIDSSTIVALMQAVAPGRVKTYTIGMHEKGYNEAEIAKEIASVIGAEHTELYIDESDAKAVIPKLSTMFGEPFADSSQIPTYLVSRMTRDHVTVSLSGDAGDELFCGYTSYRSIERIWGKMGRFPAGLRRAAGLVLSRTPAMRNPILEVKSKLLQAENPRQLHMIEQDPWNLGGRLVKNSGVTFPAQYERGFLFAGNTQQDLGLDPDHDIMLMDLLLYHPDDILVKVDRTAMAVSLETRVPFLDRDVVEFAWSLPTSYLRDESVGKKVLRNVLYRYVPKELMDRPKKGFSIPIDQWLLEEDLKDWAEGLLDRDKLEREGFLNADLVQQLWQDLKTKGTWLPQIWYVLMFEQWLSENHVC